MFVSLFCSRCVPSPPQDASAHFVKAAEIPGEIGKIHEIELRGRSATLHVYAIKNAAKLEL